MFFHKMHAKKAALFTLDSRRRSSSGLYSLLLGDSAYPSQTQLLYNNFGRGQARTHAHTRTKKNRNTHKHIYTHPHPHTHIHAQVIERLKIKTKIVIVETANFVSAPARLVVFWESFTKNFL